MTKNTLKVAVVGAGAMGSVYAGLLASAGNEVWAIDTWREHIDAIRARGSASRARAAIAPSGSTRRRTHPIRDPATS